MIELNHVFKRFGGRLAVEDLTLSVPPGEIYGLLGHNGAGKSTAIGMMLGQVWPSAGTVRVCGHPVTTHRRLALQKVGAIFESPAFYDYLSGWRNLELLCAYTRPVPAARLREVIDWVGLSGREKSKVRTYSHGMRARLALAQALLPAPELLILDEPSDGLDPEGIHEMRQTILRFHDELGLTILLSSHFLNEVEQLCTRIAVLNRGRKVFEGGLDETRQRETWVRLEVGDFALAVQHLKAAGLVKDWRKTADPGRDGHSPAPRPAGEPGQPRSATGARANSRPATTPSSRSGLVSLTDSFGTDQVVQVLVQRGIPVYEIARQEQTLEDFYLSLMDQERASRVETP